VPRLAAGCDREHECDQRDDDAGGVHGDDEPDVDVALDERVAIGRGGGCERECLGAGERVVHQLGRR